MAVFAQQKPVNCDELVVKVKYYFLLMLTKFEIFFTFYLETEQIALSVGLHIICKYIKLRYHIIQMI
jgi:hypothetical protein